MMMRGRKIRMRALANRRVSNSIKSIITMMMRRRMMVHDDDDDNKDEGKGRQGEHQRHDDDHDHEDKDDDEDDENDKGFELILRACSYYIRIRLEMSND